MGDELIRGVFRAVRRSCSHRSAPFGAVESGDMAFMGAGRSTNVVCRPVTSVHWPCHRDTPPLLTHTGRPCNRTLREHYRAERAWAGLTPEEQEERLRQWREEMISGEMTVEERGAAERDVSGGAETGSEASPGTVEGRGGDGKEDETEPMAEGATEAGEEREGGAPPASAPVAKGSTALPSPNEPSPLPQEHVVRQLVGRRARARAVLWLSHHVMLYASAGTGTAFRAALRGGVRAMSQLARSASSGGAAHSSALQALVRWVGDQETLDAVHVEAERADSAALLSGAGVDSGARPRWLVDAPTEAATSVLRFSSKSLPLGPWGPLTRVMRWHRVKGTRLDLMWRVTVDPRAVAAAAQGTSPHVLHFRLQQDLKLPSAPQSLRADPPCSEESAERLEWRAEGEVAAPLFAALTGRGVAFRAKLNFAPGKWPPRGRGPFLLWLL